MAAGHIFWSTLLPSVTLGFAAAVQPGPLSIYLVSRTLQNGWKRTFPAIFAPLITDGPIAVVCLFFLESIPVSFLRYIQILGGMFILFLAFRAGWSWKKGTVTEPATRVSSRRTLLDATLVNFLNPGPYLGWSLVIGPLFLKSLNSSVFTGILVLIGFYLTMFSVTVLIIFLFDRARDRGPRLQRALLGISALALAVFGAYQLITGVKAFLFI